MSVTGMMARIAVAAIAFDVARREALRLKRERNDCRCERVETDEPRQGNDSDSPPCWKQWRSNADDVTRLAEAKWCQTCVRRQRRHEAYRQATKARGAKARALQRIIRSAEGTGHDT